jgi:hypothetical protein
MHPLLNDMVNSVSFEAYLKEIPNLQTKNIDDLKHRKSKHFQLFDMRDR